MCMHVCVHALERMCVYILEHVCVHVRVCIEAYVCASGEDMCVPVTVCIEAHVCARVGGHMHTHVSVSRTE